MTPKIIPGSNKVIILKNIYNYTENGTPGGTVTDVHSSDWYLINYEFNHGVSSENKIKNLNSHPYFVRKGITSTTNKYVTVISDFYTYVIDIYSLETHVLPEDPEIEDAFMEQNNQNMILIEGFIDYSICSYNLESQDLTSLYTLDNYYNKLSQSYCNPVDYLFCWNGSNIFITDIINNTAKPLNFYLPDQMIIYSSHRAATLKSSQYIEFYSFASDTLYYSSSYKCHQFFCLLSGRLPGIPD